MNTLRIFALFVLSSLQICAHSQNIDSLLNGASNMEASVEKAEVLLEAANKKNNIGDVSSAFEQFKMSFE